MEGIENIDETDRSDPHTRADRPLSTIRTDVYVNLNHFPNLLPPPANGLLIMETNQRIEYVISTLIRFRKLWIIPAVAGVALALIYVFAFRGETWTARQSLIVRDDLLGQSFKPGQFSSLESMKSAQETILEIARKPAVIREVLAEMGPVNKSLLFNSEDYPDAATVEDVQGLISFSAPNGAEFGKTEVVILNAKASSPQRSMQFIQLLLKSMDKNLSEVRSQRLQSMESELTLARDGAALSLQLSVEKLRELEDTLGADVGTMNGLNSSQPGDGSAKIEISQIHIEKRATQAQLDSAYSAQTMLAEAQSNPERMLATSTDFLKAEPKLEALSKSLVESQKAYADNSGRYEPEHPMVQRSLETIVFMQQQIYQELDRLTISVESRIGELKQRISRLDELADEQRDRLVELGSKRVDHLTINSEVKNKSELYERASSRLSEIQASRMATGQVEWLTRIGAPQLATRPDGMGRKATVLAGGFCGLLLGIGLVMLIAPPMENSVIETTPPSRPGRRTDIPRQLAEAAANQKSLAFTSSHQVLETPTSAEKTDLKPATLDEMVGPTAAAAIHSATVATSEKLSKGLAFAKSAIGKSGIGKSDESTHKQRSAKPIVVPDVSQTKTVSSSATNKTSAPDSASLVKQSKSSKPIFNPSPVELADSREDIYGEEPAVEQTAMGNAALANTMVDDVLVNDFSTDEELLDDSIVEVVVADEPIVDDDTDSHLSATDILAQLRANRARQTAPKIKPTSNDSPLNPEATDSNSEDSHHRTNVFNSEFAEVSRRPNQQRPIDVAKATQELPGENEPENRDSTETIQLNSFLSARETFEIQRQISQTQRTIATDNVEIKTVAAALNESAENPFLKHPVGSKSKSARAQDSVVDEKAPIATSPTTRVTATTDLRSSSPTMPIPDQIRSLSDSIASFAKPGKGKKNRDN